MADATQCSCRPISFPQCPKSDMSPILYEPLIYVPNQCVVYEDYPLLLYIPHSVAGSVKNMAHIICQTLFLSSLYNP